MFGDNFREGINTPPPASEMPAAAAALPPKSDLSNGHRASDGAAALETITGGDSARIDPQTSSRAMSESFARGNAAFRPVFVVGCPRSGTTLLSVMLDRHSEVAVPPETHFAARVVPYAFPESSKISSGIEALPVQAVRDLLHRTPLNDLKLDPAAVIMRLRGCPASPATLLRSVLEEYAARRNKPKVAEKTPGHELYVEQLSAWFPQARFVWIVRDGRAVVKSQRRMHWIHEPIWQLSLHWRRSAIQALRFEAAHPDNIFRVRYEDLLRDPHRTLGPLHRFLGIRLEPQQLRPNGPSGVIPACENGWKMKANQPIDVRR